MTNKICIQPSELTFDCAPEKNILEAAIENAIILDHSCKTGACGNCKVNVLSGRVKNELGHIVSSGSILSCSSYAQSDLVLNANYYPELAKIDKKTLPCKISTLQHITDDILIITLRIPPTQQFNYLPGQYINLSYKGIHRSYSIANARKENSEIELHIKKISNGLFSRLLGNEIQENSLLHLSGPHGTFFIRDTNRPLIFLAGGTGFAPIKAMIEKLINENSARKILLYWGMATSKSFYFDIYQEWQDKVPNMDFTYVPVVSESELSSNRKGLVHKAVSADIMDLSPYEVYASGSLAMIEAAKRDFLAQGIEESNFYSDAFIPAQ